MKRRIYCSQRTILEALQLLITWLSLASHNGNRKQAIQAGLKKGEKSIKSMLSNTLSPRIRRLQRHLK
jgi:hypothetical protein